MFVNYFWHQCAIGVRDVLGHLAGLLCIKFHEDILIINVVALPILLEFAELADSPIYPPSSIQRGPKVTSLVARSSRATSVRYMSHFLRESVACDLPNIMREICAGFAEDHSH
jgi:hypothetical protein